MLFQKPRLVIAALRGGSGKTIVSMGLAAAWRRDLGLKVVPFKKGPDYIDAGWLATAAGQPCYNLDPFLMDPEAMLRSFVNRSQKGDGSLIEGNRGLYDGVDVQGSFSTAELAKLFRAPVILVLDATKVTRTAAALVLGCQHLDPDVHIAGVILNQVAGKRHETVLRGAIERYCGIFQGNEIRATRRFVDFDSGDAIHPDALLHYSEAQYAESAGGCCGGDGAPRRFDPAAALDWSPVWSLDDGLGQTVEWIREHLDFYRVGRYEV